MYMYVMYTYQCQYRIAGNFQRIKLLQIHPKSFSQKLKKTVQVTALAIQYHIYIYVAYMYGLLSINSTCFHSTHMHTCTQS